MTYDAMPNGIKLSPITGAPILTDDQYKHVDVLMNIFTTWYACQDSSDMGTGKSFCVLEIARRYGYQILAITPAGIMPDKWKRLAKLFGVNIECISYTALAGSRDRNLCHNYLTRRETKVRGPSGKLIKSTVYTPTHQFDNLVKSGVILVFDESQKDKNSDSMRSIACHQLVKRLIKLNTELAANSRVAVLSASPGNEAQHTISLLKLLGVIIQNDVYEWNPLCKRLNLIGFNDVVSFCSKLNESATTRIIYRRGNSRSNLVNQTINDLYSEIIKPWLSHSMHSKIIADYANGFYNIEPDYVDKLHEAINNLADISGYTRKIDNRCNFTVLNEVLREIESYKIPTIARLVRQDITNVPNSKIVVYVNNYSSIDTLKDLLSDLNPMELSGRISTVSQQKVVNLFQADSNNLRIMIVTIGTGSVGLDFNDTYGNRPRTLYLVPRYNFLEEYQSAGRVSRMNNKSVATIRFVYAKGANSKETRIIDSICRKTSFAKTFIDNPTVPFPGDYPSYVEE